MNKTQIVSALAEKAGISKVDAANYVNTIFGVIADNIVEGEIVWKLIAAKMSPNISYC